MNCSADPILSQVVATVDTKEESNSCLCFSRNERLLTGHESKFMVWADTCTGCTKREWALIHVVNVPEKGCVTCITQFPIAEEKYAVSFNNCVAVYSFVGGCSSPQPLHMFRFNADEINQLDINPKASLICACDDSGEIKVIDVENLCLYKTLTRQHDNICSTVKFNVRKPWEIFSGGLDCRLIQWNFSRGRPMSIVDIQVSDAGDNVNTSTTLKTTCMMNPPMVHCIDTFSSIHSLVCGLGDGNVSVYSALSSKKLEVICSASLHSASVACVCCVEASKEEQRRFVVSGGNDGKICISRFRYEKRPVQINSDKKHYLGVGELDLLATVNHGSKINWIVVHIKTTDQLQKQATTLSLTSSYTLVIIAADLTSQLIVYEVKCCD